MAGGLEEKVTRIADSMEATTFTHELWQQVQPMLEAQWQHPFVRALGHGTLPREKFEFYIRQDARFLEEYARTFALAATRATDPAEMERFGELLVSTLRDERALHAKYASEFGLTTDEMAATPMAPTNFAYTRHMLTIAAFGSLAELLAAILPCTWIYAEIGRRFVGLGPVPMTHPYRDWIALYGAPEFDEIALWLRQRLDARASHLAPEERARCADAFVTSTRYEYMFWDMAWRLEQWPA